MEATYESAIDRAYRKRQESLRSLVDQCYGRLLGDPVVAILVRSQLDTMQKSESIEKIIKTLIDSENEVAVARLTFELEQMQQNQKSAPMEDTTNIEEIATLKLKLKQALEQKQRVVSETAAMFASQGLQFVDTIEFSVERLLKQYRLLLNSVAAREQIIEKLYKQICQVRKQLDSGRKSSERQHIIHQQLDQMLHVADPTDQHIDCRREMRELHSQISRLRKVLKAIEESKDSVQIMSQKQLQDIQKNKLQQIRLVRQVEIHRTNELNTEIEVLKLENQALAEEVNRARYDSDRLEQEKHLLQLTVDQALQTKRSVEQKIEQFEGSLKQMKSQTDDLLMQNDRLKQQISKCYDQIARLQNTKEQQGRSLEKEQQTVRSQAQLLSSYLQQINNLKSGTKIKHVIEDTKRNNSYIEEVERTFKEKMQQYEAKLQDQAAITSLLEEKIQAQVDRNEELERDKYSLHRKLSRSQDILSEALSQLSMLKITLEFQRKIAEQESRYRSRGMDEIKQRRVGTIMKDVNTKHKIQRI